MRRLLFLVALCLLARGGFAQSPDQTQPNTGADANALAVQISPDLSTNAYRAPATVFLQAFISTPGHPVEGQLMRVNFFENAKFLGFSTCVWQDTRRPVPLPGDTSPLPKLAAGYSPAELVWTNAPAGVYVITASITERDGQSATSAPTKVTVYP